MQGAFAIRQPSKEAIEFASGGGAKSVSGTGCLLGWPMGHEAWQRQGVWFPLVNVSAALDFPVGKPLNARFSVRWLLPACPMTKWNCWNRGWTQACPMRLALVAMRKDSVLKRWKSFGVFAGQDRMYYSGRR